MSINEHILCITNLGEFESLQSVWDTYPEGGKEGDYIYLGEDLYCWDKYSRSWVIGVDVDTSQIKPINVTYAEGVIDYSEGYINYIGSFDGFEQVWGAYPNGGKDGDYILVAGERYKWNKYISNWGEIDSSEVVPARPIATVWGDLHVHNDAVIGENLYARILETFTTKKWVLEQGYIHTDDVTSDVVMSRILTDNETITKKNGRLSVIGNIGGGGVADSVAWSNITGKPLWIGDEKPKYTLSEIIGDSGDGLVTIKGDQSIEGIKDFAFGAKFGGALLKYDSSKKCWIFPNNVLVEGGFAWNTKLEGFEQKTITAAVNVDWKTIGKNENGELYVIGGTSGGGVVGGVTLDEVKNYLTAEKYTTEAWVSSQNYATQSWVTNKGYITGVTSSMVTSALGYTPFDSSNFTKAKIKSTLGISDWALEVVKPSCKFSELTDKPTTLSGYGITDAYTKTEVANAITSAFNDFASKVSNDGVVNTYKELIDYAAAHGAEFTTLVGVVNNKFDKADFSKTNIQTTLGISNWALSPTSPFVDLGKIAASTDLTTLTTGIGYTQGYTPVEGAYEYGQIINFNGTKSFTQIYISDDTSTGGTIYFRTDWNKTGLANRAWREILSLKSYAKYALPLTGGTISGALTVNSTIACDSAICSTEFLRVNTKDSTRTYAYIRAEIGSSSDKNVALAHIGACYGYGNDFTLTNAYDAIAMYRSVVGVGGTFTYDELYANQKNGISLAIRGALSIGGSPKISYDSTKNALILPMNLLVEGGVAWNTKLDGFEQQTITAAVNVDGSTLSKTSSGALCVATALLNRIVALENKLKS